MAYKSSIDEQRWRDAHRPQIATYNHEYRKKHAKRIAARKAEYNRTHFAEVRARRKQYCAQPEVQRRKQAYQYLSRYGVSVEHIEQLFKTQKGRCAVCKAKLTREPNRPDTGHVDHCHETQRVRGVLCNKCNRGIGLLKDDPARCEAAAAYLRVGR